MTDTQNIGTRKTLDHENREMPRTPRKGARPSFAVFVFLPFAVFVFLPFAGFVFLPFAVFVFLPFASFAFQTPACPRQGLRAEPVRTSLVF